MLQFVQIYLYFAILSLTSSNILEAEVSSSFYLNKTIFLSGTHRSRTLRHATGVGIFTFNVCLYISILISCKNFARQ
jgi:hypothetical protein